MKKLLLTSLLASIYIASQAQSFTTVNPVTNYSNTNVSQISQGFVTIHNGSASAKDVMVQRTVNSLASTHTGYFCWDVCYAPSVNVSVGHITVQPNSDCNSFYCDVDPHGAAGLDTTCYSFYDANNPSDHVDICLYFDIGTGISSIDGVTQSPLSIASPNPANTLSGINYNADISKDPKLVIYDLLGGKVSEIKLLQRQGTCIVNVSEFRQGIYLYSLVENDRIVATKKLVVAHK